MSDMRVVLLSCCAPCSSGAIKQLAEHKIDGVSDFIVLFYNPNIFPESEYTKRMNEQIKYCEQLGVKYAVLEYDHDAWRDAVRGFENAPERGARCSLCFEYRFRRAEKFARENGYNAIASVLGVSRHKSQTQVDNAAQNVLRQDVNAKNYHAKRYTNRALAQSKYLKKNMTEAERLLWHYLRARKDFSFRKQAPIGNYVVDFLCVKKKLVIELDAAQHGDKDNFLHDIERDAYLEKNGYRVLRFWNDEVCRDIKKVLNTIDVFVNDNCSSHPLSSQCVPTSPAKGGGNFIGGLSECPPPLAGGGHDSGRGVAVEYMPIKWDENLRIQINRASDFYRQNYCGCEFSIRKI
ncbi:MAG: epoxyqueuosine reductase QueH [Alphaproteobacteria bacterium]|nr:epoxyqueuosine reductase QueH [Alphaproteobacteria bacterium]